MEPDPIYKNLWMPLLYTVKNIPGNVETVRICITSPMERIFQRLKMCNNPLYGEREDNDGFKT